MENHEIKLSISGEGKKVEIIIDRDVDIFAMLTEVRGLLIAWGYHPNSIVDGFHNMIEEYDDKLWKEE
jgi:hypothetical protein